MLNAYLTATQNLLQNPTATNQLYATTSLTTYINTARGQLAGESESIRFMATLVLAAGQQVYPFSSISLTGSTGIEGVINVRSIWRTVASGQVWLRPRPFEWFALYELNNPVPVAAAPTKWAQYAQGVNGSIYVSPVPDVAYTLNLDCVCYPINLGLDADPEAIPYLWTDAVPYFGAYLALLSAQTGARSAEADKMLDRYSNFVSRARRFATPSVLPFQNPQSGNPTESNQLGRQGQGGQGGGG